MNIVDPRVDPRYLPAGSRAIIIAEHQPEYLNLPSIRTPNGHVITRWSPTDDERRRIMNGEDLYLTIWSHGAINPVQLTVGIVDWSVPPETGDQHARRDG